MHMSINDANNRSSSIRVRVPADNTRPGEVAEVSIVESGQIEARLRLTASQCAFIGSILTALAEAAS